MENLFFLVLNDPFYGLSLTRSIICSSWSRIASLVYIVFSYLYNVYTALRRLERSPRLLRSLKGTNPFYKNSVILRPYEKESEPSKSSERFRLAVVCHFLVKLVFQIYFRGRSV